MRFLLIFAQNSQFMKYFSSYTERIARAYNITPELVTMCHAIAAGMPKGDSYQSTHDLPKGTTPENAETLAAQILDNYPGAKILISKLKNNKAKNNITNNKNEYTTQDENTTQDLTEEEKNEFCTKNGLVRKIVTSLKNTQGKDRVAALVTLAKLQGLDKIEENEGEEMRRYFLPWVSICRNCELMKIYKDVNK